MNKEASDKKQFDFDSYIRNIVREEDSAFFNLVKELKESCDALRKAIEKIK